MEAFQQVADNSGELLIQYLRDCAERDEIATYEKINQIVGHDVRRHRSALYTAMNKVLADYGYGFECVSRQGYRPLKGIRQITTSSRKAVGKIRNTTKKLRNNYEAVKPKDLDQSDLNDWIKEGLRLNIMEDSVSTSTERRINAAIESVQKDDPLSKANMNRMLKNAMNELAGVG